MPTGPSTAVQAPLPTLYSADDVEETSVRERRPRPYEISFTPPGSLICWTMLSADALAEARNTVCLPASVEMFASTCASSGAQFLQRLSPSNQTIL